MQITPFLANYINDIGEYQQLYDQSINEPKAFWKNETAELLWQKPWKNLVSWTVPDAKWFEEGKLNLAQNCLDRHLDAGKGNKTAILWEGEAGEQVTLSYSDLYRQVCQLSNALVAQGVQAKDRVVIYMPMTPEVVVAMLACVRLGAVHSVIFAGFSADAIADRLQDSEARFVITADGAYRRGKVIPLKAQIDLALAKENRVEKVIVFKRVGDQVAMQANRDFWWEDVLQGMDDEHKPEGFDAEHPLFLLYTSGSTGKPKGILHTTAGYTAGTYMTTKYVFDLKEEDIYWCTADVGWITGHTYIAYGPLLNGATQLMYEGAPNFPDWGRFWRLIERYKVSVFYTSPTAIRAFIQAGESFITSQDLSSLRVLGAVGEPINPEVWKWYYRVIGKENCPIVDTWWQTETGSIMLTTLPGVPAKPGFAGLPMFGVEVDILDEEGKPCPDNQSGNLVVRNPWPSMFRSIYNDPQRYRDQYWSAYPNHYLAGDSAIRDADGYVRIIGRVDDVLNVSGHRLGTAEVESALVEFEQVAEAAVVGKPHDIKGESLVAFVILKRGAISSAEIVNRIKAQVVSSIGSFARPDEVIIVPGLPKTRSGKIMRRLLKELVKSGKVEGNTMTLEDPDILDKIGLLLAKK